MGNIGEDVTWSASIIKKTKQMSIKAVESGAGQWKCAYEIKSPEQPQIKDTLQDMLEISRLKSTKCLAVFYY